MDEVKSMPGINWYYEVHEFCRQMSQLYGMPLIKIAGMLSALSPNTTFRHNMISLHRFIRAGGDCKVTTYNSQKEKALKILRLDDAFCTVDNIKRILGSDKDSALKTKAFFDNIYRPETSNDVTVDRWMLKWAGLKGSLTPKKYRLIENAIRDMAKDNDLRPHELQAIIWTDIRGAAY